MHYSTLVSLAVAALSFPLGTLSSALRAPTAVAAPTDTATNLIPFPFDEAHLPELEHAFEAISAIPLSVLDDGSIAVKAWVTSYEANTKTIPRDLSIEPRQSLIRIAKCAAAILEVIAEGAIPIAKLRHLKDLIKLIGGAKKVAKLLLRAKSKHDLLKLGGHSLVKIVDILSGVKGVVNACFAF